jgi:prophage tail gpP-like protein
MSSNQQGELVFSRQTTGTDVVASLIEGTPSVTSVKPSFDPQSYYSSITGMKARFFGLSEAEDYPIRNNHLEGVNRPLIFEVADSDSGTASDQVKDKIARMFANVASYTVEVPTWRDQRGALWTPNTNVSLTAPGAMVYDPYVFTIRRIDFTRNDKSETATLTLIMPDCFSLEQPKTLPWTGGVSL